MLDIKFIRENPELIREAARKKRLDFKVERLIEVDDKRLALLREVEEMRAEQNKGGKEVAAQAGDEDAKTNLVDELKNLKTELKAKEDELAAVLKEWQNLMLQVPNVPDVSVPEGEDESKNQELRRVGKPPSFSFPVKSHIELMQNLDLADFERGVKIAGFRGYILKNDLVLLTLALWRYVLEHFVRLGFQPLFVPSLLKKESFLGTGFLPQGGDDLYETKDGFYLSGTAEVAVMGAFADEVIPREKLPVKVFAFSPCFRREAGSHGKDTKGLVRVHEFFKWEQVVLCEASHEVSVKHHEEITAYAEQILQTLKLPYRVVLNCGSDLGLGQVKKYDLEVWLPSEKKYLETHSASYYHDFQTRRLNIRYRAADGKFRFVHSLNNTAVATPRFLAALLENYQQADGSIVVPQALVPYFGKQVISQSNEATS